MAKFATLLTGAVGVPFRRGDTGLRFPEFLLVGSGLFAQLLLLFPGELLLEPEGFRLELFFRICRKLRNAVLESFALFRKFAAQPFSVPLKVRPGAIQHDSEFLRLPPLFGADRFQLPGEFFSVPGQGCHRSGTFRLAPLEFPVEGPQCRSEQQQKKKEAKKNQSVVQIKEIKVRPKTDDHDYETKLRHIRRFLEDGDRCKITVFFRGREIVHKDRGLNILERVVQDLADVAKVDQEPRAEGRTLQMLLVPKK